MTRHALITGAGSGIGAAISDSLAGAGYRLSLLGRRREPLEALQQRLGSDAHALSCDVSDERAVARGFAAATEAFGPVEVLINCAGTAPTAPFHRTSRELMEQVMAVNFYGALHCMQAAVPAMRESGWGRVITIASTASLKGYAYVSAYCAAKHAVLGLTRALAQELASTGVTVNALCPGYTDTDIIADAVSGIVEKTGRSEAEALAHFTASNPQGRLVQPQEVAASVLWLAGDGAAAVNGQAIAIDGGET